MTGQPSVISNNIPSFVMKLPSLQTHSLLFSGQSRCSSRIPEKGCYLIMLDRSSFSFAYEIRPLSSATSFFFFNFNSQGIYSLSVLGGIKHDLYPDIRILSKIFWLKTPSQPSVTEKINCCMCICHRLQATLLQVFIPLQTCYFRDGIRYGIPALKLLHRITQIQAEGVILIKTTQ